MAWAGYEGLLAIPASAIQSLVIDGPLTMSVGIERRRFARAGAVNGAVGQGLRRPEFTNALSEEPAKDVVRATHRGTAGRQTRQDAQGPSPMTGKLLPIRLASSASRLETGPAGSRVRVARKVGAGGLKRRRASLAMRGAPHAHFSASSIRLDSGFQQRWRLI